MAPPGDSADAALMQKRTQANARVQEDIHAAELLDASIT